MGLIARQQLTVSRRRGLAGRCTGRRRLAGSRRRRSEVCYRFNGAQPPRAPMCGGAALLFVATQPAQRAFLASLTSRSPPAAGQHRSPLPFLHGLLLFRRPPARQWGRSAHCRTLAATRFGLARTPSRAIGITDTYPATCSAQRRSCTVRRRYALGIAAIAGSQPPLARSDSSASCTARRRPHIASPAPVPPLTRS